MGRNPVLAPHVNAGLVPGEAGLSSLVVEKNTLFRGGGFDFFYFSGIIDFR